MTKFKFFAIVLAALFFAAKPAAAQTRLHEAEASLQQRQAQNFQQFVVAEDVVIQYVRGELRFCQRQNLRGTICGYHTKIFGKKIFEVGDWWSAQTFAQAYTQMNDITVTQVAPGPGPSSITIYFQQSN